MTDLGIMEIVTSGSYIIKRNPYDLPEGFLMQSAYIYIMYRKTSVGIEITICSRHQSQEQKWRVPDWNI